MEKVLQLSVSGRRRGGEQSEKEELDPSPEQKKRRCTSYELAVYHACRSKATGGCKDTAVREKLVATVPQPMRDLVEVYLFRVVAAHEKESNNPYPWQEKANEIAEALSKLENQLD